MVEGNGLMARPRVIQGDDSEKMTFSISDDTAKTLRHVASEDNRSLSSIVREALENYLEDHNG